MELGAEIITTTCPFFVLTLEDMVKTSGHEEKIRVMIKGCRPEKALKFKKNKANCKVSNEKLAMKKNLLKMLIL